jgi:peptidoglycan/LPS O-acetylase OafA/YrhL
MMFYVFFSLALLLPRPIGLAAIAGALGAGTLAGPFLSPGVAAHLASPIVLWFVLGIVAGGCWRWVGLMEPHWMAQRARWLELFGDASYSTYLVHGLVLTVLFRLWIKAAGTPTLWFLPVSLVVATIAGCAIHSLVEKPILRLSSHPSSLVAGLRFWSRRQPVGCSRRRLDRSLDADAALLTNDKDAH